MKTLEPRLSCAEGGSCAVCDVFDFCDSRADAPDEIAAEAAKEIGD